MDIKNLTKTLKTFNEAKVDQDNVFENELKISLENLAGGIALTINKENGNVSITTILDPSGSGMYRLTDFNDETLKTLFSNLKNDLKEICQSFDEEINLLMSKNGLKSTK